MFVRDVAVLKCCLSEWLEALGHACAMSASLLAPHASNLQDNGNAVKILEKLGVDPSKMPEEIIKDPCWS